MPDSSPIVVTFARPEESRAYRRGAHGLRCVHTGIGPAAAAAALQEVIETCRPRIVVGAGFAGALDPALAVADIVQERIVSRPVPVETVEEKAALFRETGAQAIDMETETLVAICAAAGVPFQAVRAISDTAAEPLPVPFLVWYDLPRQRPRPLKLLAWLACHPTRIAPFARFVRRLPRVSEALAVAVRESRRLFPEPP